MAKPRKMLGAADSPYIVSLMRLIETQSKVTLANWSISYAEEIYLPIYEKYFSKDNRPHLALQAAKAWIKGEIKLPAAKPFILACHEAARQAEDYPAAQAAARAAGQAASVIHSATHSLGIAFYGAAAIAYDREGTGKPYDLYNKIAAEECAKLEAALKKIAVKNEPNPAKINWCC